MSHSVANHLKWLYPCIKWLLRTFSTFRGQCLIASSLFSQKNHRGRRNIRGSAAAGEAKPIVSTWEVTGCRGREGAAEGADQTPEQLVNKVSVLHHDGWQATLGATCGPDTVGGHDASCRPQNFTDPPSSTQPRLRSEAVPTCRWVLRYVVFTPVTMDGSQVARWEAGGPTQRIGERDPYTHTATPGIQLW